MDPDFGEGVYIFKYIIIIYHVSMSLMIYYALKNLTNALKFQKC